MADTGNGTSYLIHGGFEEVGGVSYSAMCSVDTGMADAVEEVCAGYTK